MATKPTFYEKGETMRQSFKRVGLLLVAVLLALAGAISATGTASAEMQPNRLSRDLTTKTFLRPCASPCGVQDAVGIDPGTEVHTFCLQNRDYNLMYSGPSTGRAGFVLRLRLDFPDLQREACSAEGSFATVGTASNLRSCSGTCVDFGRVTVGEVLDVFCELGSGNDRWFLVFVNRTADARAGFLPKSAISQQQLSAPSCNQGF